MDSQRTSKPKIPKNSLRTNFPVSSPSSKKDITAPAMGKSLNRSNLRKVNNVPLDTLCPLCGAPHEYIYDNCGDHRQFKFKLCWQTFPLLSSKVFTADVHFNQSNTASTSVSINTSVTTALTIKSNLKKLPMDPPPSEYWKYKLRYLYWEFSADSHYLWLRHGRWRLPKRIPLGGLL